MLLGITTCTFSLLIACTSVSNVSVSVCSYLFKASSVICRDPSLSDNVSISFVLLKLVLVPLHSFHYICFVSDR